MTTLNKSFWEDRYHRQNTGWDIGYASPPLAEYLDQIVNKNISILVPGAGYGHEVRYMAQKGFTDVTVVDIARAPLAHLAKTLPADCDYTLLEKDFFDHDGQYDLILEQTFFCALAPSLRPAYAEKMHRLLVESGKLAGVLFDFNREDGPPFGGSQKEYNTLFKAFFSINTLERCTNSITPRQGNELFFIFEKYKSTL